MKTLSRKIMAFAFMLLSVTISAFADTWTDPSTGITWTYTVLDDGTVALGGGTSSTPAVPTSTSGELTVPAQINGMDVTSVMAYGFYNCSNITSFIFEPATITLQKDASYMFYNCKNIKSIEFLANWNTSKVTTLSNTFNTCWNLRSINALENWNINNVTNLASTFYNCQFITSVEPLRNWNTSKVKTLNMLFASCYRLNSLNGLENWDVSNVTNLASTFTGCRVIESLEPLRNWNTSKVTTLANTFNACWIIQTLNGLENWDVSNVTTLKETFMFCEKLETLEKIANWNTSKVTTLLGTFSGCGKVSSLQPLTNWDVSNVTTLEKTFELCYALSSLEPLANWNTSKVTSLKNTFAGNSSTNGSNSIYNIDPIASWDVSNVTTLEGTFNTCINLQSLEPLANWNVSNVTTLRNTFNKCLNLPSLNGLENWNTSKVTNLGLTFAECQNITSIQPISNWNTSNVTNLASTFTGCTNLLSLNGLENWNTDNVTSITNAFSGCQSVTSIEPISNWNTEKIQYMNGTFGYCSSIAYIDIHKWNLSSLVNNTNTFNNVFNGCTKLERIYLPKMNLLQIGQLCFNECNNLQEITLPSTIVKIGPDAFSQCRSLKEITIPSTVKEINGSAFTGCVNITEMYLMPNTPPKTNVGAQNKIEECEHITVYVKESALTNYKRLTLWTKFRSITDMIPFIIGTSKNYATFSYDFDADFSQTEGIQPYIANKYLEGEDAADYLSGFEAKKRLAPDLQKAASTVNPDIKLIVLARYPNGYVPSRTGEDNFDFHGVMIYGKPGTYYFKMGEQDYTSENPIAVTWSNNYMKSAYESWLLNPTYDHEPVNWMEYPKEDTYNFVLKNNKFKYIDNAGTISRHKSWLELPAEKVSGTYFEAGAKMVSMFDPDDSDSFATGLSFIVEDEPAEIQNRYNLNGQKVDTNYKGVVIVNGKKLYNK